jgi:carbamoyltransferase
MSARRFPRIRWIAQQLTARSRANRHPAWPPAHILGIACTGHGASIAYVNTEGEVRSSVLDRWAGVKHIIMLSALEYQRIRYPRAELDKEINEALLYGFGKFPPTRIFEETIGPWTDWLLQDLPVSARDIDLVVTSNSHFVTSEGALGPDLRQWFPNAQIYRDIEHHAVHQRQAFWQSGFSEAAVLTLDNCGESLERLGGRKLAGTIAHMRDDGACTVHNELFFPESSIGQVYSLASQHVGFLQGEEGKTMGLAPYGEATLWEMLAPELRLHEDGRFEFLDLEDFQQRMEEYVPERKPGGEITPRHADVACAGQMILERVVINAWQAALRLTGSRRLACAGGVALNSVANDKAFRVAQPERFYIATNPGDTGHALGCALYGLWELAKYPPPRCELPEYLGPAYTDRAINDAIRDTDYPVARPDDPAQTLARCIANGYIIARFAGCAEFGPRALGNRSILCDPRRPDMKDYLNARVKHREAFRPFAPSVLREHAHEWFEMDPGQSYAYMLSVVPVLPSRRAQIPAVLHVDDTARIQTVAREENPGYWDVIHAFFQQTGVPMVLNTSFNLAGKPIVETPRDALTCFKSTEIDVLALGDYVVSKRPLAEYAADRMVLQQ